MAEIAAAGREELAAPRKRRAEEAETGVAVKVARSNTAIADPVEFKAVSSPPGSALGGVAAAAPGCSHGRDGEVPSSSEVPSIRGTLSSRSGSNALPVSPEAACAHARDSPSASVDGAPARHASGGNEGACDSPATRRAAATPPHSVGLDQPLPPTNSIAMPTIPAPSRNALSGLSIAQLRSKLELLEAEERELKRQLTSLCQSRGEHGEQLRQSSTAAAPAVPQQPPAPPAAAPAVPHHSFGGQRAPHPAVEGVRVRRVLPPPRPPPPHHVFLQPPSVMMPPAAAPLPQQAAVPLDRRAAAPAPELLSTRPVAAFRPAPAAASPAGAPAAGSTFRVAAPRPLASIPCDPRLRPQAVPRPPAGTPASGGGYSAKEAAAQMIKDPTLRTVMLTLLKQQHAL